MCCGTIPGRPMALLLPSMVTTSYERFNYLIKCSSNIQIKDSVPALQILAYVFNTAQALGFPQI
jgi:hypothetical protein